MVSTRLPRVGRAAIRELIARYHLHSRLALPVPIRQVAEDEGWRLVYREGLAPLYAFAVVHRSARLIYINADVDRTYQRAAIAHEIGHSLNGDLGILQLCAASRSQAAWTTSRQERQADLAAAHILIPPWTLREFGSLHEIAAACEVPVELVELYRGVDGR